jgi:hypothetical protein
MGLNTRLCSMEEPRISSSGDYLISYAINEETRQGNSKTEMPDDHQALPLMFSSFTLRFPSRCFRVLPFMAQTETGTHTIGHSFANPTFQKHGFQ